MAFLIKSLLWYQTCWLCPHGRAPSPTPAAGFSFLWAFVFVPSTCKAICPAPNSFPSHFQTGTLPTPWVFMVSVWSLMCPPFPAQLPLKADVCPAQNVKAERDLTWLRGGKSRGMLARRNP